MSDSKSMLLSDSDAQSVIGNYDIEVYFDGECPLCLREMNMLRRLDKRDRIHFVDICAPDFWPELLGKTHEDLMSRIQARLPDGSFIDGVEVFRVLYDAVGFSRIVALSRLPGLAGVLDAGYQKFAKNRLRLTGRCSADNCRIGTE